MSTIDPDLVPSEENGDSQTEEMKKYSLEKDLIYLMCEVSSLTSFRCIRDQWYKRDQYQTDRMIWISFFLCYNIGVFITFGFLLQDHTCDTIGRILIWLLLFLLHLEWICMTYMIYKIAKYKTKQTTV